MPFNTIIGHHRPIMWLQTAVKTDHLGHAYLFHGESAIGKRQTAMALTQLLHCERPQLDSTPDACGTCRSCHQVEQAIHPDCLIIETEDGQKQNPKIKIDQIRAIEHLVIYRPLVGSHFLVRPATVSVEVRDWCLQFHPEIMFLHPQLETRRFYPESRL